MFDANVGDQKEAFSAAALGEFGAAGSRMVESFNDGPARMTGSGATQTFDLWGPGLVVHDGSVSPPTAASSIYFREQPPPTYPATDSSTWSGVGLQDYRDIGPVHAGNANVLFADGSVRTFKDQNKDGYLNPGFQIDPAANKAAIGYTDGLVELPQLLIFSGVMLEKFNHKPNLDE
jgi:prepilin-type processing-associated H-X9-DG protein